MTTPGEPKGEQPLSQHLPHSVIVRKKRETEMLAEAVWDLFNALVARSQNGDDLQELGDWWDEHKHKLEQLMRTKGRRR